MVSAFAKTLFVRISPRKARLAAGLIRNMNVNKAFDQLKMSKLKGGRLLSKTLKSAVANVESRFEVKREHLFVSEVRVDEGPTMKRAKPRNKGSRVPIMKRTSHFKVVVSQRGI